MNICLPAENRDEAAEEASLIWNNVETRWRVAKQMRASSFGLLPWSRMIFTRVSTDRIKRALFLLRNPHLPVGDMADWQLSRRKLTEKLALFRLNSSDGEFWRAAFRFYTTSGRNAALEAAAFLDGQGPLPRWILHLYYQLQSLGFAIMPLTLTWPGRSGAADAHVWRRALLLITCRSRLAPWSRKP